MAEHKHQQQDLRAGHQHLANLRQEDLVLPAVVLHQNQAGVQHQLQQHQVALAEAGSEAYLHRVQRQLQASLVAVQHLEQQRPRP